MIGKSLNTLVAALLCLLFSTSIITQSYFHSLRRSTFLFSKNFFSCISKNEAGEFPYSKNEIFTTIQLPKC